MGRVLWALLLLVSLGIPALPRTALAHGALRRASPASGAHLSVAPHELRLTFNEALELAVSHLDLLAPDGRPVALAPLRRGETATTIVTDIAGPLVAGTYTVVWQVAGRDGHPVRGRYRFTIDAGATGIAAPAIPPPGADTSRHEPASLARGAPVSPKAPPVSDSAMRAPTPGAFDAESPLYAVLRWLGFVGLITLVGTAGFTLFVVPGAQRRGASPKLLHELEATARRVGLAAGALLALDALLRLFAQSAAVHGAAHMLDGAAVGTMITGTMWGAGWMLMFASTVVALLALAALSLPSRPWTLLGACAVVACVGAALSGHAIALEHGAALGVATHALHLLAAGGWIGTLTLVAAALPTVRRLGSQERGSAAAALVNAFSPWALACAAGVAITGAVAAWLHLGGAPALPAALWSTAYGRTLLVKLAVLAPLVATGAYNWRRVRPALHEERGSDRLARSATIELGVAALVLAVTAVLVATPPNAVS